MVWHDGQVPPTNIFRLGSVVVLGVALISAAACSPKQGGSVEDVTEMTISDMASPTDPLATSPPTTNADKNVPEEGTPAAAVVDILVDTSEGGVQEAAVLLGSPVNIRVRSATEDEFHLHGYDLELKGTDILFSFTADRLGEFVLESHESSRQLLVLTVFQD